MGSSGSARSRDPGLRPAACHRGMRHLPRTPRQQRAAEVPAPRRPERQLPGGAAEEFPRADARRSGCHGYMWGMAAELDDPTIEALAKYYSSQRPLRGRTGDPALAARGREIYEHGIESEGVPACSSCHGADGHGVADFPRLASQRSQYILNQLASFQSNMRNVAVMHGVAQNLRTNEMQAVAAYLEGQP